MCTKERVDVMNTKMICPYDPQQCDYPRCLNKGNPNYYDQRCAEIEMEIVLRTAQNIANEVDRITEATKDKG